MNILATITLFIHLLKITSMAEAFTSPELTVFRIQSKPTTSAIRAESGSSKERKPWDVLRFVSQSSKFVRPPPIPFLGGSRNGGTRKVLPGETIWSPSSTSSTKNLFQFAPLDDVVMGGVSSSTIDNNTGMWTGTVTDENNGGFVGIRSTPFPNGLSMDMSDCKGMELRLRLGDGKRFKFVVRDSTEFNGVCWTTSFDAAVNGGVGSGLTKNFDISRKDNVGDDFKGITVRIPFDKQVPTIFAKTVPGKVFDVKNVVGFQLAYSKVNTKVLNFGSF